MHLLGGRSNLAGHSDVLAGAVVCAREDEIWEELRLVRHYEGAVLGPFEGVPVAARDADVVRARRAAERVGARESRSGLAARGVAVRYPGPALRIRSNAAAARQMARGYGGMLSIQTGGGAERALRTLHRLRVWVPATSLGGVESLVEHDSPSRGRARPRRRISCASPWGSSTSRISTRISPPRWSCRDGPAHRHVRGAARARRRRRAARRRARRRQASTRSSSRGTTRPPTGTRRLPDGAMRSTWNYALAPRRVPSPGCAARATPRRCGTRRTSAPRTCASATCSTLRARGVPVVPTHLVERGASLDLGALDAPRIVIKPEIGAGSLGARTFRSRAIRRRSRTSRSSPRTAPRSCSRTSRPSRTTASAR